MQKLILLRFFVVSVLLWIAGVVEAVAQLEEVAGRVDYTIDSLQEKELSLEVDNISFFKDNEFGGSVMKGYTLPGLWIEPKLSYQPLSNLKVEAGVHALIYSGAYRYPTYAYHDIAAWKGHQFQQGAHVLPWFRAHLSMNKVNLVLGNLYGGANHGLSLPLYNPELVLTADPEFGFQVLADTRLLHFDAWLNWESFIFKGDTHQEAFVVGTSSKFRINADTSHIHAFMTLQGVAQHRGGEQDTAISVQTWMNGAVGAGVRWNADKRWLQYVQAQAQLLGYFQESGRMWPFAGGSGIYAEATARFAYGLHLRLGWFRSNQFISLLGIPYFGSVSTKKEGAYYTGCPQTLNVGLDYSHTFAKRYTFGAKVETYYHRPGALRDAQGVLSWPKAGLNTSFGVYLRIRPRFVLGRF
ncbi:MAG: hypothetical protein IIW46_01085 [Bacteroidaceae bacterium]|nr:hypothetical protein [Bacteroidaceae bacterium]